MKNLLAIFVVSTIVLITACKESKVLPVASFKFNSEYLELGDTVYFENTSQNANTFEWDFGDGYSSSEENPFHLYSEEGNYEVQLVAYNEDGSDMTSAYISIQPSYPCWSLLPHLPTPRHGHMVAIVNNKIYLIGGITSGGAFEVYDLSTNSWEVKANAISRELLSGCVVNGKIYAIGGWSHNKTYDVVEEYDPVTDSWNTKSPMPTARWGHAAIPVNDKIYVIGGALDWPVTQFYTTIEIYDPAEDSWTTLTGQGGYNFKPRNSLSACVINDKIYAMGGNVAEKYPPSGQSVPSLDIVEEYDPELNIWTQKTSMSFARMFLASVTVNNKIYVIGGADTYRPENFVNIVEEYDPITDSWEQKSSLPYPIGYGLIALAACEKDNIIYIPGGGDLGEYDAFNYFVSYDPECDTVSK